MMFLMIIRWLQYLTAIPQFSSLVLIIGLMIIDISTFIVVWSIVLLAWAALFIRLRNDDPRYTHIGIAFTSFFRASLGDFDIETLLNDMDGRRFGIVEVCTMVLFLLLATVLLLN